MAGQWVPEDIASLSPKPVNVFENPTTVQFNHRWLVGVATSVRSLCLLVSSPQGTATLAYVIGVWALARGAPLPPRARLACNVLAAAAFVQASIYLHSSYVYSPTLIKLVVFTFLPLSLQVGLGIATLLTFVPTPLASSHQAGAVSVLSVAIWLMHELRKTLPRL